MMDYQKNEIRQVFDKCSPQTKKALLTIRQWVYEIAKSAKEIGEIKKCLNWAAPSYVSHSTKTGITLRLSELKSSDSEYGLFVHCQTSLIEWLRLAYPYLKYDKNRGVIFDSHQLIQADVIKQFIYLALSYHSRKIRPALACKFEL